MKTAQEKLIWRTEEYTRRDAQVKARGREIEPYAPPKWARAGGLGENWPRIQGCAKKKSASVLYYFSYENEKYITLHTYSYEVTKIQEKNVIS